MAVEDYLNGGKVLRITRWGEPVMHAPTRPVTEFGDELHELVRDMFATMDVAMNTQAVEVERRLGRPCISSLHGMYSLGGLTGAIGAAIFAGMAPVWHFTLLAVIAVAILPPYEVPQRVAWS